MFTQTESILIKSTVRPYYYFLSLRLVRNPSGFSERFPTSGNDINVTLLKAFLVCNAEPRMVILNLIHKLAVSDSFDRMRSPNKLGLTLPHSLQAGR
jgi:hypothetical protein